MLSLLFFHIILSMLMTFHEFRQMQIETVHDITTVAVLELFVDKVVRT